MSEFWTPNQLRVIRDLLDWDDDLNPTRGATPTRRGLRDELLAELERLTQPAADLFAGHDKRLTVTKFDLTSVHKCEGLYVAPDDFEWTVPKARGKVVHRAIQKSWAGRFKEMPPLALAREAVESMASSPDDRSFGDYLNALDESSMAELLSGRGRCSPPSRRIGHRFALRCSRASNHPCKRGFTMVASRSKGSMTSR